jgi:5-methyltetrahydropteroyltriglutamate--homocysteine methyltransferase
VVESGLLVQIDDAFLASYYDVMVPPLGMEDYRKWAALRVDALNHALRGIPPSDAAITSAGEAGMDLTPMMSR